jgi:hypothetical protein
MAPLLTEYNRAVGKKDQVGIDTGSRPAGRPYPPPCAGASCGTAGNPNNSHSASRFTTYFET